MNARWVHLVDQLAILGILLLDRIASCDRLLLTLARGHTLLSLDPAVTSTPDVLFLCGLVSVWILLVYLYGVCKVVLLVYYYFVVVVPISLTCAV